MLLDPAKKEQTYEQLWWLHRPRRFTSYFFFVFFFFFSHTFLLHQASSLMEFLSMLLHYYCPRKLGQNQREEKLLVWCLFVTTFYLIHFSLSLSIFPHSPLCYVRQQQVVVVVAVSANTATKLDHLQWLAWQSFELCLSSTCLCSSQFNIISYRLYIALIIFRIAGERNLREERLLAELNG